jgi:molybdate transport system substrate-binding protein
MRLQPIMARAAALGVAGILLLTSTVQAAEVRVVSSGGFAAAYRVLAPANGSVRIGANVTNPETYLHA